MHVTEQVPTNSSVQRRPDLTLERWHRLLDDNKDANTSKTIDWKSDYKPYMNHWYIPSDELAAPCWENNLNSLNGSTLSSVTITSHVNAPVLDWPVETRKLKDKKIHKSHIEPVIRKECVRVFWNLPANRITTLSRLIQYPPRCVPHENNIQANYLQNIRKVINLTRKLFTNKCY